jgi:hypothetical protein
MLQLVSGVCRLNARGVPIRRIQQKKITREIEAVRAKPAVTRAAALCYEQAFRLGVIFAAPLPTGREKK